MAGSISNAYETNVLNWLFTATNPTKTTGWTVGLFTDAVGISADPGPATEATTGNCPGYGRQTVTFSAASAGTITNNLAATFTATGAWAAVNYFGIFDQLGVIMAWGSIPTKTLANTDQLKFDLSQITITMD